MTDDDTDAAWHHYEETLQRRQEMDLTKFIEGNSSYLKASDLKGHEVHVRIASVEEAKFEEGNKLLLKFQGKEKGLILNMTNARRIASKCGTNSDEWVGREVVLYEEEVDFQGRMVPAIRVRVPAAKAGPDDEIPF
jgi:hypothetical protein